MICRDFESAKQQAQANADYFQREWVVFFDAVGCARCEQFENQQFDNQLIIKPRRTDEQGD
jgi:hypothetical protein